MAEPTALTLSLTTWKDMSGYWRWNLNCTTDEVEMKLRGRLGHLTEDIALHRGREFADFLGFKVKGQTDG